MQNATTQNPMHILKGRTIRVHCPVYPTSGYSDYPNSLSFLCFFVALVQLVAAVIWTFQIYYISAFSLRLDIYTVGWTPRLDGALDTSSRRCIRHVVLTVHWTSRILLGLYPWDLKIVLSLDHQNHSKWPKWGHVRYNNKYCSNSQNLKMRTS